ncbi:hypothetical protein AAJ76_940006225 [Vairimorpha ceranae]|uniref:Uncharacterized protein n=1 Tax=Vairimorpha ceranae TaxID=40302 RepID=A0A0F9Z8Q3_9MICR|nr:hypothetical protein AAJ76_940006225 [Vairimorpha ceranae]KKO74249.1 hypothetical protein AAJ76_940006225 [Vairimorpha ceranae]
MFFGSHLFVCIHDIKDKFPLIVLLTLLNPSTPLVFLKNYYIF